MSHKKGNRFKLLNIFTKQSILYIWPSSQYASGSLKLFCCGFKRDTREGWSMPNWLNFLIVMSYMYNIQANERLTRVKEKRDIFILSFIFFIPMYQTKSFHKQKWYVLLFTCIKLVAHVLVSGRAIVCVKWRILNNISYLTYLQYTDLTKADSLYKDLLIRSN